MHKPWEEYQAIYVHIPFCLQKCLYCDFASYANCGEELKTEYVKALCKEIGQSAALPVSEKATIYFGGGTPSTLSVEQISEIVDSLKSNGYWRQPIEATIEVNPGTVDEAKLEKIKALGFTRISMGVQSLNNAELKTIGRIHNAKQALEAIKAAEAVGFKHINADVIYGLPGQTLESLQETLAMLTATAIDHISVYGLIVEENTPLCDLVEQGKLVLPDEDAAADMYEFVQSFLKEQGFARYEVSNYARDGKDGYSRHNDSYWHYYPYAAFGASAVAFDGKTRTTRPAEVRDYINWANTFAGDKCMEESLGADELLSEYMLMGLRRVEGANLNEAKERYHVDVLEKYKNEIAKFFQQGLLAYNTDTGILYFTEKGMELGNQVFEAFV